MPNWVMNRLVLTGTKANEIADKILSKDENGKEFMNFNNIDRMPDSLNCVCGSPTIPAAEYYLALLNPDCELTDESVQKLNKAEYKALLDKVNNLIGERDLTGYNEHGVYGDDFDTLGGKQQFIAYGKQIVENRANYGHSTWYEWSNQHWGVKWNASSSRVSREKDEVEIYFETPWNGVPKVICAIGDMAKDIDVLIEYDYSEEQAGYLEFHAEIKHGHILKVKEYEEGSKAATKHYMKIWGYEDDFIYDPETDNYISRWDVE